MVTSKRGTASPRTPRFLQGRRDTTTNHKSRNLTPLPPPLREAGALGQRAYARHRCSMADSRPEARWASYPLFQRFAIIDHRQLRGHGDCIPQGRSSPPSCRKASMCVNIPQPISRRPAGVPGSLNRSVCPLFRQSRIMKTGKLTFWFSYSNGLDAGLRLHRRKYLELMLLQSQAFSHQRPASFGKEGGGPRFNTL